MNKIGERRRLKICRVENLRLAVKGSVKILFSIQSERNTDFLRTWGGGSTPCPQQPAEKHVSSPGRISPRSGKGREKKMFLCLL